MSFSSDQNKANQGVLDLREWDLDKEEILTLDGEWTFYPSLLLSPNQAESSINRSLIPVPGDWRTYFPEDASYSDIYGTYQLRILVPDEPGKRQYRIQFPHRPNISNVFVNDELVIENKDINKQESSLFSRTASFTPNEHNEVNVTIHIQSNSLTEATGFFKSIKFSDELSLNKYHLVSIIMQLTVAIITFIHFVYGLILYLRRRRHIEFLYFSIAAFFATVVTLLDDDKLLLVWLPINFPWSLKILFVSYIGITVFMLLFVQNLFREYKNSNVIRTFNLLHIFFAFLFVLSPLKYFSLLSSLAFTVIVLSFAMISILIWKSLRKGVQDTLFLLFAAASVTSSFLWAFYKSNSLTELPYYPFDIIFAFLAISIVLFNRFFHVSDQNMELAIQLQKEIKQKDDFLANTSHELRNPLHGMINIAQSVLQNKVTSLDVKSEKNIELLITIGRHMSRTLDDLLDITLLKEHRVQLQKGRINIHSVSSGVVDMLHFMVENKNIQLESRIPNEFPDIMADKNRLIQIFFNLLHNAVKYTNEGIIIIDASIQGKMANIHITDTGIGMDEETMSRIFEPYEQGDSSMTSLGGGLGLGLSICKQLVEMHGGTLKVSSTLGEGSVFTFSLPLIGDSFQQQKAEPNFLLEDSGLSFKADPIAAYVAISDISKNSPSTYRPRVLVVDDNPINLNVLSTILSDERYEVETALSGKEALNNLAKKEWDLVITDVMMPHMSGYELTRAIRKTFSISELPVLLLTARSQPEDIYTGFLAGANDYVTKPVDALELNVRVHALTDLKESINERLQMEAAWLQAQIKPHFLFNTLNTIISLSEIDTNRMALLLDKFGRYLRKSFDMKNLNRTISLEHELELVRSYIYIEKERFGDRLQVIWEIDAGKELQIPPLSIQTLVENAINHGVLKRIIGGTVTIRIRVEGDYTRVSIMDDGIGMDEEKVKQVFTTQPDKKSGIGLLNTNQRLKQLYGDGLVVKSVLEKGTIVTFQIPKGKL